MPVLKAIAPKALSCVWAVGVFVLVLLCPGYLLGWLSNLFAFRSRTFATRIGWAVCLSFCVSSIFIEIVAKVLSLNAVCWIARIVGAACLCTVVSDLRRGFLRVAAELGSGGWIALGGLSLWMLLAIFELIDIPTANGSRLLLNVAVYDHALRTAFVDAVVRTGVPPVNPLYWPGHPAPLRYYYFWYIMCAMVAKLGHVSARTALIASCVWSGIGLASLIDLFARHFRDPAKPVDEKKIGRIALTGIALLTVTGLDVMPYLGALIGGDSLPDIEWWSDDQITSWLDTLLWVPHHMAALLCCMMGLLLLWLARAKIDGPDRWIAVAVAGCGFASAFGLSSWMAIGFAILMLGWLCRLAFKDRRTAALLVCSGVVSATLLLPFLHELRSDDAASPKQTPSQGALLSFGLRRMVPPGVLDGAPGFRTLRLTHPGMEAAVAKLALMPLGYALELGFYGAVLVIAFRRRRALDEAERLALGLAIGCLVLTSFVRSTLVAQNDFAIRATLIAQFFLLLLAARMWDEWRGDLRLGMVLLAGFGVAGSLTQAVLLRVYLPVEEARGVSGYTDLAEHAAALRQAYDKMDRNLPVDAVVGYLPSEAKYDNFVQTLYLGRQAWNEWPTCNTSFGGSPMECEGLRSDLATIYSGASAAKTRDICRSMNLGYLVTTRWEPVWSRRESWAWTLPPVVSTDSVRVVWCGP